MATPRVLLLLCALVFGVAQEASADVSALEFHNPSGRKLLQTGVKCILANKDFVGIADIPRSKANKANAQACALHCVQTSGCVVAVYDGTRCFPKNVSLTAVPTSRSGYVVIVPSNSRYPCSAGPPPPVTPPPTPPSPPTGTFKCSFSNRDFPGLGDLGKMSAGSSAQCASICANTSGCTVAVFSGSSCYPKNVENNILPSARTGFTVVVPTNSPYPCFPGPTPPTPTPPTPTPPTPTPPTPTPPTPPAPPASICVATACRATGRACAPKECSLGDCVDAPVPPICYVSGIAGTCSAGSCVACTSASCPSTICDPKACVNGTCTSVTPLPTSSTVCGTSSAPGTCQNRICVPNPNCDAANCPSRECRVPTCNNNACTYSLAPVGSACSANESGPRTCDARGDCTALVNCSTATFLTTCPTPGVCKVRTCNNGVCGSQNAPAGSVCGPGLTCNTNGECNATSNCSTFADCPAVGECRVKSCTNNVCGANVKAPAGTVCSSNIDGPRTCDLAGDCTTPSNCSSSVPCPALVCKASRTCETTNLCSAEVPLLAGTVCNTNQTCDGTGNCTAVENCSTGTNGIGCTASNTCKEKLCVGNVCQAETNKALGTNCATAVGAANNGYCNAGACVSFLSGLSGASGGGPVICSADTDCSGVTCATSPNTQKRCVDVAVGLQAQGFCACSA